MLPDKRRATLEILPQKLAKGSDSERFHHLLTDFDFIEAKVEGIGIQSLIKDYTLASVFQLQLSQDKIDSLELIQNALRLSEEAIVEDKRQLGEQLLGRLMSCELSTVILLLNQVEQGKQEHLAPWLRHKVPTLTQAQGPLRRTLNGHTASVETVAVTPDGQHVVSGSRDTTLKIWNIATGESLKTLKGHTDLVHSVVVARDGQSIVSASSDGTTRVWDFNTGTELRCFNFGAVNSIAITPDSRKLATAMSDATIRIWDLTTGDKLRTLKGHNNSVDSVVISSDGKLIVSMEGASRIISKASETRNAPGIKRVTGKPGSSAGYGAAFSYINSDINIIESFDFEPSSQQEKGVIRIWDFETGFILQTLTSETNSPASVLAISLDQQVVIAESSLFLKTWRLEKRGSLLKASTLHYLKGHTRSIYSVAITPDATKAVSTSRDSTLKIWDLATGANVRTLLGHTGAVSAVAITPDGRMAISASDDHSIKIWDLDSSKDSSYPYRHNRKITDIKTIDNGQKVLTASWDNKISVWNISDGRRLNEIGAFGTFLTKEDAAMILGTRIEKTQGGIESSYEFPVNSNVARKIPYGSFSEQSGSLTPPIHEVVLMPNEKGIVAALDGGLMACDLEVGINSISSILYLDECSTPVLACAASPDGCKILLGTSTSLVDKSKDSFSFFRQHQEQIANDEKFRSAFAKDSLLNVSLDCSKVLRVWDTATLEIRILPGHTGSVNALAVTPNGHMAISASDDTTLKVWDLKTYEELHTLIGHTGGVTSVIVMPDGCRAISASRDSTIKVWDLTSGTEMSTFRGHKLGVNALSITPNGETLVSASWDKTLKVWNVDSGEIVASFKEDGHLLACAIAPDGVNIVAGEESGKLHFLTLEGTKPIQNLWHQAQEYRFKRDYKKAELLYLKALSEKRQYLGTETPSLAFALREIAEFYVEKEDYSLAVNFFMEALSIQKHFLGENHFEVAVTLVSLGNLYEQLAAYEQAASFLSQSLSVLDMVSKSTPNSVNPNEILRLSFLPYALCSVAQVCRRTRCYDYAEEFYQRALSLTEKTRGKRSLEVAKVLENLATLYQDQGRHEEAESLMSKAFSLQSPS